MLLKESKIMSKVKICVFSDYHYCPALYPQDQSGLDTIIERAHTADADVILECGDFAAGATKNDGFLQKFLNNKYGIKTAFCYGNHELEQVDSLELLNKAYGVDNSYFYKDMFGFRFITVDTNFWYDDDGTLYHYPGRGVGSPKGWDYDDNAFGKEQLEWIAKTIDESPYPCILLGHTPVDLSDKPDHKEFLKIIKAANEKNRGRVLIYFSGDKHRNHIAVVDDVLHFNINATYNGEWRPTKHNLFPKEFTEGHSMAANCSIFKDPLSAIVTVEDDGHIKIEGMETDYMYGVTPEMYGGPFQCDGYGICEPRISSGEYYLLKK